MKNGVNTCGRVNDDFVCFLYSHRETRVLLGELTEESDQFRFLEAASWANLKDSLGLMLTKTSVMRVTILIDLSTRSFIRLPR